MTSISTQTSSFLAFETQKQMIKELENEVKSLKQELSSTANNQKQTDIDESMITTPELDFDSSSKRVTKSQIHKVILGIRRLKKTLKAENFEHLQSVYPDDFNYILLLTIPRLKKAKLTQKELARLNSIAEKLNSILKKFTDSNTEKCQTDEIQEHSQQNENPDQCTSDLSKKSEITQTQCSRTEKDKSINQSELSDLKRLQRDIFANCEGKIISTLKMEMEAALKKSSKTFDDLNVTCNCPDETVRIQEIEKKLKVQDHLIVEQSKIINEHFTAQANLKKVLAVEQSKIMSLNAQVFQLNALVTDASQKLGNETSEKNFALLKVQNLESQLRESSRIIVRKDLELAKLKTQFVEEKQKSANTPSQISKYEILLSEKETKIAEYLSVLGSILFNLDLINIVIERL